MSSANPAFFPKLRYSCLALAQRPWFTRSITWLIVINAIILGMETYPYVMESYGALLKAADRAILWVFVVELLIRLLAYGTRFFKDPWGVFDLAVVVVAFMPANEAFSVLRAVRVLRVLRLISIFPRLRRVIEGLVSAIPGIGSIGAILMIIFYVFAVMATKLFGTQYHEWFGTLQASAFTLFQIMTLEGWADIVREIGAQQPFAYIFFVIYILIATFTVLNLFIAVIVDAMQREHQAEEDEERRTLQAIREQLVLLDQKISRLEGHGGADH